MNGKYLRNPDKLSIVASSCMHGQELTSVILFGEGAEILQTKTRVPDDTKLFNFVVRTEDQAFLVLDNYGDETIPDQVMKRLPGHDLFSRNLAINQKDGALYTAFFYRTGSENAYAMGLDPLPYGPHSLTMRLPKKYIRRLDELMGKKRPYAFTCWETAMWEMIDQEEGYANLRENIVVDLDFDKLRIQLWGNSYREVSSWHDV